VSDDNQSPYYRHVEHLINPMSATNLLNALTKGTAVGRLRALRRYGRSLSTRRVLLKAPLTIFSVEWLVTTFKMKPVIVIRHPGAFVNSYKMLGWSHPFEEFLGQPTLMRDWLRPFQTEIVDFSRHRHDVVDQAALLWKLIHHVIARYREAHEDWIFVRHEDLALDPVAGFRTLFDRVELVFGATARLTVEEHDAEGREGESQDPYSIRRDGRLMRTRWRQKLTRAEIERVRDRVAGVAEQFYSADEW
jgi:hypothetical protein